MAHKYWIKLYHEVLYDPKMCRLDDRLYRRVIELFLLAGETDQNGVLPKLEDMAYKLRTDEEIIETELIELQRIGIVSHIDGHWIVTKFSQRQKPMKKSEYMKRLRSEQQQEEYYDIHYLDSYQPVTNSNTEKEEKENRKDESENAPPTAFSMTDEQIMTFICNAGKLGSFPNPHQNVIRIGQVRDMIQSYGYDKTFCALEEACEIWVNTDRKTGPPGKYFRTNLSWIDRALELLSGGSLTPTKSTRDMTQAEYREHKQAEARRLGLEVDKLAKKMGVEK